MGTSQTKPQKSLNQELSFFYLLKKSWTEFTLNWKKYILTMLTPIVFWLLAALMVFGTGWMVSILENYSQAVIGISVFFGIIIICLFAVSILISYASAYAVMALSLDDQKTLKIFDAYKKAFSVLGKLILVQIVFSIIVFIGFLFLIIPGIIFLIWFSLASYIIINEKEKVFSALAKSKNLIKGDWWKVFILMLAGGVLISILLPLLINVLIIVFDYFGINEVFLVSAGILTRILVSLITVPLFIIFVGNIYQVLNKTKSIDQKVLSKDKKTTVALLIAGLLAIFIGFSVLVAFVVSWSEQRNNIEQLNQIELNQMQLNFDDQDSQDFLEESQEITE